MNRVFVDMDGVLVDFEGSMQRLGMTGDELKKHPGGYAAMRPIEGAIAAVHSLTGMGFEVWVATKPPTGISHAYAGKAEWVLQHLPDLARRIVITHDKGMLGDEGDFLIDDRPHRANCEAFRGTLIPFGAEFETGWASVLRHLRYVSPNHLRRRDAVRGGKAWGGKEIAAIALPEALQEPDQPTPVSAAIEKWRREHPAIVAAWLGAGSPVNPNPPKRIEVWDYAVKQGEHAQKLLDALLDRCFESHDGVLVFKGSHRTHWIRDPELNKHLAEYMGNPFRGDGKLTLEEPIDMILTCPQCHTQHIDAPEEVTYADEAGFPMTGVTWSNPPHRTHRCSHCGYHWRPADVPTNGVAEIETKGRLDGQVR